MTLLSSLQPNANVGIVGASGGIGRAFVDLLAGDAAIRQVHAFSRTPSEWTEKKVVSHALDLTNEASIETAAAAAASEAPLDLVIVATGILHRGEDIRPEKSMREIESRSLAEVLAVNAIGPSLVAKHFLPGYGETASQYLRRCRRALEVSVTIGWVDGPLIECRKQRSIC